MSGKPESERPKSTRGKVHKNEDEVLQELLEYIVTNGGVDDGQWSVEIAVRKDGASKGSQDVYFHHPSAAKKLRSKLEVARLLNLQVATAPRKKPSASTASKPKPGAAAASKPSASKPGSSLLTPQKRPLSTPGSLGKTHNPSSTDYTTHNSAAPRDAPRSVFKRAKAVSGEPSQPLLTKAKPKPHVNHVHHEDRAFKPEHPKTSHQILTSASTATNHSNEQRGNQANYNPLKRQLPHETSASGDVQHAVHQGRPSDGSKSTDPMQRSSVSAATQGHMHVNHAHHAHASDPPQQLPFDRRRSSVCGSVFEASQTGSQKTPRLGVEPKAPVPKFPSTAAQPRTNLNSNLNLNVPDKDSKRGGASGPPGSHSQDPTPRMSTTGAALRTPLSRETREAVGGERGLSGHGDGPSRDKAVPRTTDGHTKPSVDESHNAAVALASFKKAISGLPQISSQSGVPRRGHLAQQAAHVLGKVKLPVPMKLPHGVVLQRLGRVVDEPGFHKFMHLSPPGHLTWWKDDAKSVTIFFIIGSRFSEARSAPAGDRLDEAPSAPKKVPSYTIAAVDEDAQLPAAWGKLTTHFPNMIVLAQSIVSPSDVIAQLVLKAELAKKLLKNRNYQIAPLLSERPASAHALYEKQRTFLTQLHKNSKLLQVLQKRPLPPVRWPKLLFGLSHPAVLACLEAQDSVEKCSEYQYVEARRGWQHEQMLLESELHLYEAQAFKDGLLPESHTSPGNPYIPDLKGGVMGANNVHRQ